MPTFPKDIRDEIRFKYALRDDNGKRIYTQGVLAEEYNTSRRNIVVFSKGFESVTAYYEVLARKREFESYSDFRIYQYLLTNKSIKRGFKYSDLESRVD